VSPGPTSQSFPIVHVFLLGGDEIPDLEGQTVPVRLRELAVVGYGQEMRGLVLILTQLVKLDDRRTVEHKSETVDVEHVRDGDVEVFPAELDRDGNEGKDDWDVIRVLGDPERYGVSVEGAGKGEGERTGQRVSRPAKDRQ
jgi:hypothetical protein